MRPLYTESDLREVPEGTVFEVPADAILTPAALDVAFLRRVDVRRTGEPGSTGGAVADSSRCPRCAVEKLEDGTWFVEVNGGKTRIRRII